MFNYSENTNEVHGDCEVPLLPVHRVKRISVRCRKYVDHITFVRSDGSYEVFPPDERCFQEMSFQESVSFVLEEDEFLVEIKGRSAKLLDAVQFVTNRGRKSIEYGNREGGFPFTLYAAPGSAH